MVIGVTKFPVIHVILSITVADGDISRKFVEVLSLELSFTNYIRTDDW